MISLPRTVSPRLRRFRGKGIGREMVQGAQPTASSQRLGLSTSGAGDQITEVPGLALLPWSGLQMLPGFAWRVAPLGGQVTVRWPLQHLPSLRRTT